jgi:hypothetical protein
METRLSDGESGQGSLRRWYRFNASVSAGERRRPDKALLKDEMDAVSSSWLNGKEA